MQTKSEKIEETKRDKVRHIAMSLWMNNKKYSFNDFDQALQDYEMERLAETRLEGKREALEEIISLSEWFWNEQDNGERTELVRVEEIKEMLSKLTTEKK